MNAGFLRRSLAFIADALLIFMITVFSFQLIGEPIFIARTDEAVFNQIETVTGLYREDLIAIEDAYYDGDISEEEYNAQREALDDTYYENYPEVWPLRDDYLNYIYIFNFLFYLLSHTLYMIITKGHSVGRKLVKIKLSGNITILSIVLRELFWKYIYYILTIGIGLFIDIYLIILSHDKKTFRDRLTGTRVILDDIVYPF
ncbi:MAG: RDD family protein [Candidatus Izemoplasmataceae bacterium]